MKKLIGLLFGAGAAGYATLIIVGIAITTVGGLGITGYTMYQNWITGIQNEATTKCVQAIDQAEYEKLKADKDQLLADLAAERQRTALLQQENSLIKTTSAGHHQEIKTAMDNNSCTILDKVVDTVNTPLRLTKNSVSGGIK